MSWSGRMSRLMQARGLKQSPVAGHAQPAEVAPHAGAWIETAVSVAADSAARSRLMQARGLKLP